MHGFAFLSVVLILASFSQRQLSCALLLNGLTRSKRQTSIQKWLVAGSSVLNSHKRHRPGVVSTSMTPKSEDEPDYSMDFFTTKTPTTIASNSTTAVRFSTFMIACGAMLGPFLDSYHSAFGVLEYDTPLKVVLWGSQAYPALTTAWWVPELFGLAGFIIGWLYVWGDAVVVQLSRPTRDNKDDDDTDDNNKTNPSIPTIFLGISLFTFQYWLSGVLFALNVDRTTIFSIMSIFAGSGFLVLDGTMVGFLTSIATALGGPLIEVGLLSTLSGHGGYHYNDPGETGFFPLWILPAYFLGGPAVGNLARGFGRFLISNAKTQEEVGSPTRSQAICLTCNDTRCVDCPNCDGNSSYVTYGRQVKCNCCKGRGYVICRDCFSNYNDNPNDIENIRAIMSRMPD